MLPLSPPFRCWRVAITPSLRCYHCYVKKKRRQSKKSRSRSSSRIRTGRPLASTSSSGSPPGRRDSKVSLNLVSTKLKEFNSKITLEYKLKVVFQFSSIFKTEIVRFIHKIKGIPGATQGDACLNEKLMNVRFKLLLIFILG